jgi:hypothetical protein
MTPPRTLLRASLAAATGWFALGASAAIAGSAAAPVITVSEPEGFESLSREQALVVDVYFGGVDRGEARVLVAPGKLTFLEPAGLVRLLPEVDQAAALPLLSEPLATHPDLACTEGSERARCGRLSPDTAGVIFDRDRFRVDVFLNPRFLEVHDALVEKYLPPSGGGLSMVNDIGALLSGQTGPGADYYNLHDRLIVGDGARRLRADLSLATDHGFGAESIAAEWDRPELRYSAGALWSRGSDLTGRRKLLGGGIETQIDTRLDKDRVYGSPIVVYLERRARVDVVRDGRVMSSAVYDAGNQSIETADLPDGSYEIVLRITEAGQPAREERRFFSKSQRIPSLGRTDFFAFGGMLVEGRDSGALKPSNHPYAEGGVSHRLSRHWAIGGTIEATDRTGAGEIAATFVAPVALVRAAAVADTEGTVGGILQVASTGNSRLNFNLDLRRIEAGRAAGAAAAPSALFGSPYLDQSVASYSQASGYFAYSIANVRFAGTAVYRKDDGDVARYSAGPSVEWDVLRKGPFKLTLHGDFATTDRGTTGFAGLSLQFVGGRLYATADAGARATSLAGDELGEGAVGSLAGTWTANAAGGELALGAGYHHQPRQSDVVLSSEFRHPLAQLNGELIRSDTAAHSPVSQYTAGFQTTVSAGGGTVKVAGRTTTDSMIVAHVDGARSTDRFEVLVDEQVVGTIDGARTLAIPLPAYRGYEVRIRPVGNDLVAYDNSPRSVGLYPGAVSRLAWTASPITIKLGRLLDRDGQPVAGASIAGKGAWSQTDAQGNFQIEAPDDAELTVTTPDGRSYSMALPKSAASGGIARLGTVVCCGAPSVQLGALDSAPHSRESISQ